MLGMDKTQLKGIFILIDGMGDLPHKSLNGKTPLEAANTSNMDFLATRGEMGYMYPVKPGFVPESDEAIVSIFGNNINDSTRGQLEARGAGINLKRGDLALRVNFATIDNLKEGNIKDRRAGRTLSNQEAQELSNALIEQMDIKAKFVFQPTIQHRAALVFKGGYSDNFQGNDATYNQGKSREIDKIAWCKGLDKDENTQYTVNVVNEFIEKSFKILNNHPVNKKRKERGLMPANYLLIRGPGIETPKLKKYKNWISVNYMPLEKGFSEVSGIKNYGFNYPKLKGINAYENLWRGLRKACKYSTKTLRKHQKDASYVYIHIKETDLPGHDNKPFEKKNMLEYIDKTLIKYIKKIAPPKGIKVVISADHSTPCKNKNHSADPVPVLFYNGAIPKEKKFNEKEARKGTLGRLVDGELFKKVKFKK
ncbi:MAG TPA: alkaline phosphatase family protein [Candidatus Nanoarchaeia archaeon]|nr:alkaline phosphatase family protein [Candidatus Nanoarchaeia archaeon]